MSAPFTDLAGPPAPALAPRWSALRCADAVMAVVAVVWMSDALVRLGGGSLITAAFYAYFTARFLIEARAMAALAVLVWPLLLFPAVALASALWSPVPEVSLIGAVQVAFTILVAGFVGAQFSLDEIGLFAGVGLALTMLASAANLWGLIEPAYSWGGGFLGIYTNKNALGQRAVLLVLLALYFLLTPRAAAARWGWAFVLAGTLVLLALSRSATSILMAAAMGGLLSALLLGRRAGLRPYLWVAGLTAAALVAAVLIGLRLDPVTLALEGFGKNRTLTGRTVLWEVAAGQIAQKPLLGTGFLAYWSAPEYLQETQALRGLYGATVSAFHNFVLEIAVGLGLPGILAMGVFLGRAALWARQGVRGAARVWAMVTLATLVLLSLLGSSLYRPHEISLFLIAALGVSAARGAGREPPPGARTP